MWSQAALEALDAAAELDIAVRRTDGGLRASTPVWVARVGGQAYARTWDRRVDAAARPGAR
jgi:hypothetical protein